MLKAIRCTSRDSWIHRTSSPHPVDELREAADDAAHGAYDSYAVDDEPSLPTNTRGKDCDDAAPSASSSGDLDLQPLIDRITKLAGENVSV